MHVRQCTLSFTTQVYYLYISLCSCNNRVSVYKNCRLETYDYFQQDFFFESIVLTTFLEHLTFLFFEKTLLKTLLK